MDTKIKTNRPPLSSTTNVHLFYDVVFAIRSFSRMFEQRNNEIILMKTAIPFAQPLYVMVKPVGAKCNLACDYCYYLEKEKLNPTKPTEKMSERMLETFVRQYIASQTNPNVLFTWHGGEPLLHSIDFYKKALLYQKKYGHGYQIDNSLQTNGTLLNDAWCAFFKENNFLIGISIDGPAPFHDAYRKNRHGSPSFDRVVSGIRLLQKHGVEFNVMAVVNDKNVDYPIEFYNFFKQLGSQFIQFAPIVERLRKDSSLLRLSLPDDDPTEVELAPFSVNPAKYGKFLCTIFDEWVKQDVGQIYVQQFDAALANWVGSAPGVCIFNKTCGHAAVMEQNGDVYACDHYVFSDYKIGNILDKSLTEMMYDPRQKNFGSDKFDSLPRQCKACKWVFACNGECPKNRFATTTDGETGLNYLCEAYRTFFAHIAPAMEFMKEELANERPPANIMYNLPQVSDCPNR